MPPLGTVSDTISQTELPSNVDRLRFNEQFREQFRRFAEEAYVVATYGAIEFVDSQLTGRDYQVDGQRLQRSVAIFRDQLGRSDAITKCQKEFNMSISKDSLPALCPESQMSFGTSEIKK